jgi:hypothetical protein
VLRLCSGVTSQDPAAVLGCLRLQRRELSAACRDQVVREQVEVRAAASCLLLAG